MGRSRRQGGVGEWRHSATVTNLAFTLREKPCDGLSIPVTLYNLQFERIIWLIYGHYTMIPSMTVSKLRGDSDWNQGVGSRDTKKRLDSRYVLKEEPKGFP